MEVLYILLIVFILSTIILLFSLYFIKKDIRNINERLILVHKNETNILIDTITKDQDIIQLANLINENLKHINELRIRYNHEENEIKNTITNISHDLRTPITTILGYLQMFNSASEEQKQDYLTIINNRLKTLKQLIEELFSYSMIYEGNEQLDINKENINLLLEDSIAMFYNDIVDKKYNPIIEIPDKPVYKNVDKLALKRVFNNLLSNVIKYGKDYLRIALTEESIIIQNKTDEFNQIDVGKLFDRFFTVKSARNSSTGLGLTISKNLIEKMNGKIVANLDKDLLSFTITLK